VIATADNKQRLWDEDTLKVGSLNDTDGGGSCAEFYNSIGKTNN
jgi:hypothetical protein